MVGRRLSEDTKHRYIMWVGSIVLALAGGGFSTYVVGQKQLSERIDKIANEQLIQGTYLKLMMGSMRLDWQSVDIKPEKKHESPYSVASRVE